ncbi:MAG: bifunctional oligoribonuclease/PAP phosphatase NrnA [Christensenellaceae bacterium]
MDTVLDFLKEHDYFAIVTHLNPDGDAIGSAFALAQGLHNLGKQAKVVLLCKPPKKYDFEEFSHLYVLYENRNEQKFEAIVSVDCATLQRLSKLKDFFGTKPNLNIDHHISNTIFGQFNYVEDSPSTGEIIYRILNELKVSFDHVIRMTIYMAMATDTGNFTYSNTTSKTLDIFAKLVKDGLEVTDLADKIFNKRTFASTKLIARFIDHIRLYKEDKLAISVIMQKDFEETGAELEDCEILIDYAREIDTVEIAVFVREMSANTYKVSFRANKYADVGDFAARFGGGGHVKASGCMMKGNLFDVLDTITKTAEDYLQ